eukprot:9284211-Pyramimonas_sp.AAC.1
MTRDPLETAGGFRQCSLRCCFHDAVSGLCSRRTLISVPLSFTSALAPDKACRLRLGHSG